MMRGQERGQLRSPSQSIELSRDSIDLTHHTPKFDQIRLNEQNKFLRKKNEILKKELDNLSVRLDSQLRKRLQQQNHRPISQLQDVSQMQIQNVYKKCQIYRKQMNFYKKKFFSIGAKQKYEDYERKLGEQLKEIASLRDDLKQMKKINNLQEKGLVESEVEGRLKISAQSDKHKEENRRLKKQLDEYRRGARRRNCISSQFECQKSIKEVICSKKDFSRIEEKINNRIKKENSLSNNEQLLSLFQKKIEKDYLKIKSLAVQKDKLREMLDNMKLQLTQKDKQNSALKEKIANLRKNNQVLQSIFRANDQDTHEIEEIKRNESENLKDPNSKIQLEGNIQKTLKSKRSPQNSMDRENENQESRTAAIEAVTKEKKYPRVQDWGEKQQNTVKWNYHEFNSKIKQIHVLTHELGYIKDIQVRYELGEVKKQDRGKYSVFVCGQSNEYIKYISGGFKDGYLHYLTVITNTKRTFKFCRVQLQASRDCHHFTFQIQENEYPMGLFGENDMKGVRRLGCFIYCEDD